MYTFASAVNPETNRSYQLAPNRLRNNEKMNKLKNLKASRLDAKHMQEDQIIKVVQTKIYSIRNQKVMLDSDIADIYGVETKRINEAVKNNPEKFPLDFMFELNDDEQKSLRSKISTIKSGRGQHRKYNQKVFTEQGVYMVATILKSPTATSVTVAIMRAFVAMRHFSLTYGQIVEKLSQLDGKIHEHDEMFEKILQAISELIHESQTEETKKIGFV